MGNITIIRINPERGKVKMKVNPDPLRDAQDEMPTAYCDECGAELYGDVEPDDFGHVYCNGCKDAGVQYDAVTAQAVMDAMDEELKKYLSDTLRDTIWNTLAQRFPAA